MKAEANNGYLRTNAIPKNAALLPPDEHEMLHSATLQVGKTNLSIGITLGTVGNLV